MARKWNQGREFKATKEEGDVQEAAVEGGGKKFSIPLIVCGGAAVIALAIVLFTLFYKPGDPVEDPITDPTQGESILGDDDYWEQFEDVFSYTDEERANLRAWGYTGTEIEENESNSVPAEDLIEQSRQAQEEARATLSNPESPEYQALLNNTWLGQDSITLPQYEEGVTEAQLNYETVTLNADYEKIPAHGHNLFLKVYLDGTNYAFMECPLLRYIQLPDAGNIVVQYTQIKVGDETIISNMSEVYVK